MKTRWDVRAHKTVNEFDIVRALAIAVPSSVLGSGLVAGVFENSPV